MVIYTLDHRAIEITYDPPPIPQRHHDYCATFEDYDPERRDPRGFGPTPEAALIDLFAQEVDHD